MRATGTTPSRKSAFYNLAIFFATQNDAANVERCLRNAIYLAPNWFKPHWTLSRLLFQQGRFAEAGTEADLAVSLDGGKNSEVVETWAEVRTKLAADQRRISQ
jgi:cytochrome c-type biogenesis protein CcmH/NrfG